MRLSPYDRPVRTMKQRGFDALGCPRGRRYPSWSSSLAPFPNHAPMVAGGVQSPASRHVEARDQTHKRHQWWRAEDAYGLSPQKVASLTRFSSIKVEQRGKAARLTS
jgi:hypothetical protein